MTIAEAVELARSGREAGYRYLYETTYKSKYYLALQYMKNEDDAQDVIQDAYIRAFSHLENLERPEAFSSWLGRIVANTAKNALVKKNPISFTDVENEDQEEDFTALIQDERIENQPELSYTREETRKLVHELIDSLSDEQRVCILMFHIEGESIKDIAQTLGCSENTVKSRLNYGRKNLKLKAEELEKKGYKLFGIVPLALLLRLLQKEQTVMAAEGAFSSASAVTEMRVVPFVREKIRRMGAPGTGAPMGAGAGAAAGGAAGSGAAAGGAAASVAVKVLAGVIAAALVGIGGLSVKLYLDGRREEEALQGAYETVQETQAPETDAVPENESTHRETEAETEETAGTTAPPEASASDAALEQYRAIINQASSYDYGENGGTPTGNYRYALVFMEPDDTVPALLLSQENSSFLYHVRLFSYEPETGVMLQPEEVLEEGAAGGYYRASLAREGDGYGLQLTAVSGGAGETQISRVTLSGETLKEEQQWSGRMDQIPQELAGEEIHWYDSQDMTGLEALAEKTEEAPQTEAAVPAPEPSAPVQETEAVTDGDRLVFSGTIDTYSYDEVVALQGQPDPNGQWADRGSTYRLIVLDTPQDMELRTADGYKSGQVRLINVTGAGDLSAYDGQSLTFSIDPDSTYWPGDTSLPLGQPSTVDVHILN